MTLTAVVVDSREPDWIKALTFGGLPVMVTYMEHGDLLLSTNDDHIIAVERKEVGDLLNSIADGRLMVQLSGMRAQTKWSYLVVVGSLLYGPGGKVVSDRGVTGWDFNAVQGALATAQELGTVVVHCGSDTDFESCIIRLGNRSRDETPIWPNRPPRVLQPGEQMLACLPGIGMERAQKLFDHFGTVCDALEWLTNLEVKDENVAGIGLTTRRSVRRALQLGDREWLAVRATPPEFGTKEG